MPPRRSCFLAVAVLFAIMILNFNATTAFLLHHHDPPTGDPLPNFNATTAFLLRAVRTEPQQGGSDFNATTAFLLLGPQVGYFRYTSYFNATTAFLLLGIRLMMALRMGSFQCHHGVPASRCNCC